MKAVINSKKHIVQEALGSITGVDIEHFVIAQAIEGAASSPVDLAEGANVKAIWLEMWITNSAANIGSFTAILYKNPGGSNAAVSADLAALHDYTNKKNILYSTQGLTPPEDTNPLPVFKGWIKIPKGKQRFGLNDSLLWSIRNNTTDDLNFCGLAVYKEYR